MEIDVNKLVYLLLLIGFVYLVYKIIKRLNPSTKANKIRETMPSKSDLRDEAIKESYHFAQTLAGGFLAHKKMPELEYGALAIHHTFHTRTVSRL
ncbi:MAG: hypothetical protein UDM11_03125 [Oscillospiraceae bacterium]|nr:hypothetical protein [Oscillospiraceae bacterium]